MRAGQLDRDITLKHRVTAAADVNGSKAQTFVTYVTVPAQKIDAGGREYFAGQQVQAEITTRFKIRFRDDVVPTDRIDFDGKSFNISHVQELGRREGLMIFASAVVRA